MAAICFTLLCTSLPIALWKENNDSLYLGKWLLFENGHHMAAISKSKMAAIVFKEKQMSLTLSVVTKKVFISPFRSGSDGLAIFNFTMAAALLVLFCFVGHTNIPVHIS